MKLIQPPYARFGVEPASLETLVQDLHADQVETLCIMDCNPVYDAPVDYDFHSALQRVRNRIHQGLYHDETALQCEWHIPLKHNLESWSDACAYDGTVTTMQPLIEPLYRSRSPYEMLYLLTGEYVLPDYDTVRNYWRNRLNTDNFESWWRRVLHDGFIPETAAEYRMSPSSGRLCWKEYWNRI